VGIGSFLYSNFQRRERLDLIDLQIRSHAELLKDSDFVSAEVFDPIEADEKLQDILGGYRVGLFLIIRNTAGEVIYRNHNAAAVDILPDVNPEFESIDLGQHILRLNDFSMPVGPASELRYVQIGQVLNKNFLRTVPVSSMYYVIFPVWFLVSMVIAYFLAGYLFAPIKKLSHEVDYLSSHLELEYLEQALVRLDKNPDLLARLAKDEFHQLRSAFQKLLRQFVASLQHNISTEGYLVHEINTPLTVAKNKVEETEVRHGLDMSEIKTILSNLAKFAQDFLSWSSLQYLPVESSQLFAIDVVDFCRRTMKDLKPIYGDRMELTSHASPRAFASLSDMEHVLQNLLVNALKYSPPESKVLVEVDQRGLSISDEGPGLGPQVLKKLGRPFNYGPQAPVLGKSTGMGLAVVVAVTDRYGWKLRFEERKPRGLKVHIQFETEDIQ
jgi:signal transduction histidine kinase